MKTIIKAIGVAYILLAILSGCQLINGLLNQSPPIANGGSDQSVMVNTQVTLDGQNSSDPNGLPITYAWSFSSIPPSSALNNSKLINATSVVAYFSPDAIGIFVLQLTVSNGKTTDTDYVNITVNGSSGTTAYTITLNQSTGGTISVSPSKASYLSGEMVTITGSSLF